MMSWLLTAALYALSMGLLRWLGGLAAAADAIQRWGLATGSRRRGVASISPGA